MYRICFPLLHRMHLHLLHWIRVSFRECDRMTVKHRIWKRKRKRKRKLIIINIHLHNEHCLYYRFICYFHNKFNILRSFHGLGLKNSFVHSDEILTIWYFYVLKIKWFFSFRQVVAAQSNTHTQINAQAHVASRRVSSFRRDIIALIFLHKWCGH